MKYGIPMFDKKVLKEEMKIFKKMEKNPKDKIKLQKELDDGRAKRKEKFKLPKVIETTKKGKKWSM